MSARPPVIRVEDLPFSVTHGGAPRVTGRKLDDVERGHIAAVLAETSWNITRAAEVLGVDRGTLYNKIQRYKLERPAQV